MLIVLDKFYQRHLRGQFQAPPLCIEGQQPWARPVPRVLYLTVRRAVNQMIGRRLGRPTDSEIADLGLETFDI